MLSTATPTPQARAWASRIVAEYDIRDRAQDILARLYVPGLPEVVTVLHTAITDAALQHPHHRPLPPLGPEVRAVAERLDPEMRWSALLWCRLAAGYQTIYFADDPRGTIHGLYLNLVTHLKEEAGAWDAVRMGLLLEAASQYLVPLEHVLDMCEDAPDAALRPHLERLRDLYAQACKGSALFTRTNPAFQGSQIRLAQLLLRLDAPLPLGELFAPAMCSATCCAVSIPTCARPRAWPVWSRACSPRPGHTPPKRGAAGPPACWTLWRIPRRPSGRCSL
ncbi:hypothetical protein ACOQFV_07510 [Nocardiopsis changdeensis]|uniref:Uncharacterized protein n=1 Tax=Nocardiopsis changdeensis TaxID=2831969 RepID=A0ABX8BHS5_9ACTN|nr:MULTISPECIES: hypothetical protein [Nocardiopsis]QUX20587.1 hypothetical protein KGD84_18960 [Nocardiopsis changdeensis]QYX36518.1 hypothetical protein K1J57_28415 [Nocardiopsis sp. MT53]